MKQKELTVISTYEESGPSAEELVRAAFLAFLAREATLSGETGA